MTVREVPWPTLTAPLPLLPVMIPVERLVTVPPKDRETASPLVPTWVIVPALVTEPVPAGPPALWPMMIADDPLEIVAPSLLSTSPPPNRLMALPLVVVVTDP